MNSWMLWAAYLNKALQDVIAKGRCAEAIRLTSDDMSQQFQ
jgi:hypothetical protein